MPSYCFLESENPDKDISLYINSPGGVVTAGLAIYDTMQFIKPDVSTLCIGQAASAAALLLCAGAEGKRFCLPNSRVMIHQPLGGYRGQATDIEIHARETLAVRERLNNIMSHRHAQQPAPIRADLDLQIVHQRPDRRAPPPSPPSRPTTAATPAGRCAAAPAARTDPPPTTSGPWTPTAPTSAAAGPAPSAPAARHRPAPPAPSADAPGAATPAPGSTTLHPPMITSDTFELLHSRSLLQALPPPLRLGRRPETKGWWD